MVIRGNEQRQGFDYEETYAPVARLTTLKTLLVVINERNLHTCQLDVKNAFLHGQIKEEVYMRLPLGFKNQENKVCRLKKALYGLQQAPRAWNETFDRAMNDLNFQRSEVDKCLYVWNSKGEKTYLLLYVDDIIISGDNQEKVIEIKKKLMNKFRMKDLGGIHSFLGVNIYRTEYEIRLSQSNYLQKLLKRFGMEDCRPAKTPMELKPDLHEDAETVDTSKSYRELVGCLMYVMLTTRPDLSVAINYYSRYQTRQTDKLWTGLKRVLRYLKGTLDMQLSFRKGVKESIRCYADADYGSETDRKSTSGYLIQVYGNPVLWSTRRQSCVGHNLQQKRSTSHLRQLWPI